MRKTEIFCPKCRVCPICKWKWIITQCLWCKELSPYEDWYHDPNQNLAELREEQTVLEDA